MLRKHTRNKFIIVLICLVMFGNLTHGLVLCFGSHGHVALEYNSTDCCGECSDISVDASQNSCSIGNYSKNSHSCGNCIDIALPGSCDAKQLMSFVAKNSSNLKVLRENIISAYTNNSLSTNKERFVKLENPVSDTLISISTTVLIV